MTQSKTLQGYIFLLLTAFLWGTAFVFQKNATDYVNAFEFNFLRFTIAIPALLLLLFLPKSLFVPDEADSGFQRRGLKHSAWFVGGGAGVFMFLGISLQQWGLTYTTAGKSGFLTGVYIIIVPIFALFVGQRCRLEVWVGAVLTVLGIYFLGGGLGELKGGLNRGDVVTLICALAWAAQVLWLGIFARYANVLHIAVIQMLVVAGLSGLVMLVISFSTERALPSWETLWLIRYDVLYTGVISAAVAFTLQIFGQRYVPATNAALIMSAEAVFALLAGVIFLDETVTLFSLLGCLLILAGIMLAQLQGRVFKS